MRDKTDRPLRILLVVSSYLPNLGGLQRVSSALAAELQRRGQAVLVLTNRYPRTLPAHEEIDGVQIRRLLFLVPRLRHIRNQRFDLALAGMIVFPTTLVRLLKLITQFQPDVVNLHFVGAPALSLVLAHKLLRFRFVVSLHGDDVEGYSRGSWFDRWVMRTTLAEADAVTACSQYLLTLASSFFPGIQPKSRVIYNGVDLPDVKSNGRMNGSLVAVGRMIPKKGFDVLLLALRLLHDSGLSPRLTIIGDGPERERLQAQIRTLQLGDYVEMSGPKEREAVHQAVHASRLVVIPSRQEPFGLVALEAMAEGKPIVATRVGGLTEILGGAEARLADADNAAALAEAIRDMLARVAADPALGEGNRAVAARFSLARMTDQYLTIYANPQSAV